jgi:small multidrug resistance family-3 protein
MSVLRSALLFVLAGLCEIGGGWLVWQWLREQRPLAWGAVGGVVLMLYGVVPTLQPATFGRVYAAYGAVFIALSLLWAWRVDGVRPDVADMVGAVLAVCGAAVIMYWPRA